MKRLIYFILGLLVASCYDDKGNYTYQEVNTLDVSLNKVYSDMASSTRLDWNRI